MIIQYTLPYLPGFWDLVRLAMSAVAPSVPKSEESARVRMEAGPCSHGVLYRRLRQQPYHRMMSASRYGLRGWRSHVKTDTVCPATGGVYHSLQASQLGEVGGDWEKDDATSE
jgi:hypothetical protein